jgi:hypothetical protein
MSRDARPPECNGQANALTYGVPAFRKECAVSPRLAASLCTNGAAKLSHTPASSLGIRLADFMLTEHTRGSARVDDRSVICATVF